MLNYSRVFSNAGSCDSGTGNCQPSPAKRFVWVIAVATDSCSGMPPPPRWCAGNNLYGRANGIITTHSVNSYYSKEKIIEQVKIWILVVAEILKPAFYSYMNVPHRGEKRPEAYLVYEPSVANASPLLNLGNDGIDSLSPCFSSASMHKVPCIVEVRSISKFLHRQSHLPMISKTSWKLT
jgi:hypothetical protein